MILKETLRIVVKSQAKELLIIDYGVPREKLTAIDLSLPYAILITGVRRCGKSTLLRQLIPRVPHYFYFNFEDTRLVNFSVEDFQRLNEVFLEEFGPNDLYFFDEIQDVPQWEVFVRTLLDKQRTIFIMGSNASLMSKELGTRLTGRHLKQEMFPFSYREMLEFTHQTPGLASFESYLQRGGFPDFLKYQKPDILRELFSNIIERDILVRHRLRNAKVVKEMALYLLTNTGNVFSYTTLKKTFHLGSTNSAIAFVSYFEDSYLLFIVPKFDYSLKKQVVNPKKIYSVDNGLSSVNSASFSSDTGRMLENVVFGHLRRHSPEIFYFKGRGECDFLVRSQGKIIAAIQVCYDLTEDNKDREINGLMEVLTQFNLPTGIIVTFQQEDHFSIEGRDVRVLPAWRWMSLPPF